MIIIITTTTATIMTIMMIMIITTTTMATMMIMMVVVVMMMITTTTTMTTPTTTATVIMMILIILIIITIKITAETNKVFDYKTHVMSKKRRHLPRTEVSLVAFQKAFDQIWMEGLLVKVLRNGIASNRINWIKSYL